MAISSIIDNDDKNKHRTEVILYSKECVKIYEVKDFLLAT